MVYKLNPLTGQFDEVLTLVGYTGELLDSTSTPIAVVSNGLIKSTYFSSGSLLLEGGDHILLEDGFQILLD